MNFIMARVSPIDLDHEIAGWEGRSMELLVNVPPARWGERDEVSGASLLHFACSGPNMAATVALVQSGLVDVNARDKRGLTPAHMAALYSQPRALEVLCAAGADLRAQTLAGETPIDFATGNISKGKAKAMRVLVANGVRLSTMCAEESKFISSKLWEFERRVLRCRTVAVAMLRVKKSGKLWRWDKFLLREVACCIWSTRYDKKWRL